jgi:hypothetical protein
MNLHEQARAEAEKRYPFRTHDTEVMRWQKRQHRVTFTDGYLAGHEAATRTRVVTTVDQLDALPIGSVVLSAHGIAWQRLVSGWHCTNRPDQDSSTSWDLWYSMRRIRVHRRFRVLHDPEETR